MTLRLMVSISLKIPLYGQHFLDIDVEDIDVEYIPFLFFSLLYLNIVYIKTSVVLFPKKYAYPD